MIVKRILGEELITLAEARELLKKEARASKELSYEKRKAVEHAEAFSELSAKKAREMVDELKKLDKVTEEIAIRICDLMPRTKDEIRAIYAKERFTIGEKELNDILDIVSKYS